MSTLGILLGLGIFFQWVFFIFLLQGIRGTSKDGQISQVEKTIDRGNRLIREEITNMRHDIGTFSKDLRTETQQTVLGFGENIQKQIIQLSSLQKQYMDGVLQQLEKIRVVVEGKLETIQKENTNQLEKMRETVDEKLQSTLEKRLSESFKSVSERLELVHKGLGEMQTLASGVGDLKKVLSNVKTRGTWGEIQLGNLLEQVLTRDQYELNVATKKNSSGRVEFAIKLPGRIEGVDHIWLPIDAKFPIEDYQRLLDAEDAVQKDSIVAAKKALERRLKDQAKDIKSLYIDPPHTTDFAMMFLPIEGLYAEVLKMPGFVESIQREYRVMITGPTTITAILTSLQMGFKTLAIEKQSSEIWKVLAQVKTEFGRFGDVLDKTQKKLQEASHHIEQGSVRARAIEKKLGKAELLTNDVFELDT